MPKNISGVFALGLFVSCLLFGGGVFCGYFWTTGGDAEAGAKDTARVRSLKDTAVRIERGISKVASTTEDAGYSISQVGKEIERGRSVAADIKGGIDKIAEGNITAEQGIGRIEEACTKIEQTISQVKKVE